MGARGEIGKRQETGAGSRRHQVPCRSLVPLPNQRKGKPMITDAALRRKVLLIPERWEPSNHVQLISDGYTDAQIDAARAFLRAGRSVKRLQRWVDNLMLRD